MSQYHWLGSVEFVQTSSAYSLPAGEPVESLRSVFSQRSSCRWLPSALDNASPEAVSPNVIVPLAASPLIATLVMSGAPVASPAESVNASTLGPPPAAPASPLSASSAIAAANATIPLFVRFGTLILL